MTSQFKIVQPTDIDDWDAFVERHPQGTVFHTSAMIRAYERARQFDPLAIAAVDDAGQIAAMLVAVRVETVSGIASRFASRSVHFAEPLSRNDEEGIAGLTHLVDHHDRMMRRRTLFAEVRPIGPPRGERAALESCGYEYHDYLNYVVDLSPPTATLWTNVSKSCRNKIRRSERRGVVVNEETSPDGVERMYECLKLSYARSQVPLADRSLFHAALAELPSGSVQIRVARHEGRPVAAGIALIYKSLMYAWYGGGDRLPSVAPFDCLTWSEIQWGSDNGLRRYDFGGAGWPDEDYGPREFKAKFGGELVSYGRYRKVFARRKLKVAETIYHAARRIISPHIEVRDKSGKL